MNKYKAKKTWSILCNRQFDSRLEARRGEELELLERAGEISDLRYQVKFTLCETPRITYTADFAYLENGKRIVEDSKGILTRETRVKLAWLEQSQGIHVELIRS